MTDYKSIFEKAETSLIKAGSVHIPSEKIRETLDKYKHFEGKTFSDAEYFEKLVLIIFYSGFRAATVSAKADLICNYFPDYEIVSSYTEDKIKEILANPNMIRNKRKVTACIDNAKVFKSIVNNYGSFQAYIDGFAARDSFENLILLKEELEYLFNGLGRITTYHFLTDIGMEVLKPDRVIGRIFQRLVLIENPEQLLKTIIQGRKFAQSTGYPIRYIDIVFVSYGQMESQELGLTSGICLEHNPLCTSCGVTDYCNYYKQSVVY